MPEHTDSAAAENTENDPKTPPVGGPAEATAGGGSPSDTLPPRDRKSVV